MLQDLKKIIDLIPFEDLDQFADKVSSSLLGNQQKEVFNLLKQKPDLTQDQLFENLQYNFKTSSQNKLIYRLKNQLLNGLVLFDLENVSNTTRARKSLSLYKKFTIVKSLQELQHNNLSVNLAKSLILETQKFQAFDLTLLLAELLEYHYSFVSFDPLKSRKYERIYNDTLEQIVALRKVSKLYYILVNMVLTGKNTYQETELKTYKKDLNELMNIKQDNIGLLFHERIYSIQYFYYLLIQDYQKLLEVAQSGLKFFCKHQPDKLLPIFTAELRISVAYLFLQEYKSARTYMNGLERFNSTPGTLHWNSAKAYHFTLEMLTKNYQSAADIHQHVTSNKALKNLDNMWIQQWNIRSAYIHFLAKIGLVDLAKFGKKRVPNFRLGRFLNDVPLYSKDKRGYNISIIIAQFLILLADKKYEQIYDRIEALSKYSYRHLKNDYRLRSNCFIRMLLTLPRAEFHPVRANRYAKKYIERLGTTELNLSEYSTEIEIIPYEDLWEIVIDLLSQRKIKNYQSPLISSIS